MTDEAEGGLRARLLDCALAMVDEEGVQALTLRAIARRAEVSHGAPLRHFAGRAALLSAVAAEGYRELVVRRDRVLARCGPQATAVERLSATARMYVRFAVERQGLFELMSRPDLLVPSDPLLRRASRPVFEMLVDLVSDAQTEGWRADADTRLLTASVWSAVHGFAQLWLMGALTRAAGADSLEDALQVTLRTLGLGPDRPGPPGPAATPPAVKHPVATPSS